MEIKCYLPRDLFDSIERRCSALNISKSEYLRLLASLDIYNINYQNVLQYFEILNHSINEIQVKLGIASTANNN